jgi:putative flippase GtrA
MKAIILRIIHDSRARYLFIGGTSAVLEYSCFLLLVAIMGVGVIIPNVISFLLGLIYTFLMHHFWTFKGDHTHAAHHQFVAYATLALINVLATSFVIALLVHDLHILPFIAKLICMSLVATWNYLLLNKIIFKRDLT